jgi:hypothetical protein
MLVPLGTLIGEFAGTLRRAASFPDALQEALARLRERTGAESIVLLETAPGEDYRGGSCSLPAHGIVINRLRHYPHPLTLTSSDFETWLRWAREFRPEHTAEIEGLEQAASGSSCLRAKHEIVGVMLGPPAGATASQRTAPGQLGGGLRAPDRECEAERAGARAGKLRGSGAGGRVQRRLLPPHPPRCDSATLAAFTAGADGGRRLLRFPQSAA